jgi:hypothetical protein
MIVGMAARVGKVEVKGTHYWLRSTNAIQHRNNFISKSMRISTTANARARYLTVNNRSKTI